jgi:trk system potassium uptake protein
MNYRIIIKVVGGLLALLGLTQGVCLLYSWIDYTFADGTNSIRAFGISTLASTVVGLTCILIGRRTRKELLRKEAIAAVGVGWLACTFFGAIPYMLAEPSLSVVDSIFESMSGFTTTGASVINDLDKISNSILLWRALTQWLGGMGIIVLFVALLSSFRIGSRAIFRHESSAKDTDGLANHTRELAGRLWTIYLGLTIGCFVGLKLLGMSFLDAVCHTFATVSTGGFGTYNDSVAHFDSLGIELWLIVFMILGSINFILYAWIIKKGWSRWKQDEESKVFFVILTIATLAISLDLFFVGDNFTFLNSLRISAFQVVSIMTTSGFVTADFGTWPPLSDEILLLLMIIGGCAGSTAGGIKLSRWILFMKSLKLQLGSSFRPNRIMSVSLNSRPVSDRLRTDTLFFVGLAGVTVLFGSLTVSVMEPTLDIESCLSAVLATLFNIGPGLGEVGPTHNFAQLAPYTKLVLSLLMALGRLEFYTILALFLPSLWKSY